MIKITYSIFARPDVPEGQIRTLWMDEHRALLQRRARARGIVRYVQTLRSPSPIELKIARARGVAFEAPSGMAELYWESIEALETSFERPEAIAAYRELLEDEKGFTARSVASPWIGTQRQVI
ncbi:EthD domain-containing protein [Chelatococcus asaccharovorans]|uniref:EthD domain-containing protein n=1 Tax=Chelatococcus asaccharovorans TaxID=28210 RepID=A0A2V3TSE2_9HYPH|nr:EthD domain-containing protein [Chelatococcus asaccharovorans]MBS7707835.1 EthD domain-containing protein [Chelatococcus asaccharovorans]PXW50918.1 EthD domain-containing protein [Chelatococcus asaccharovorans]